VIAAFGYWGVHTGAGTASRILLGVGAPFVGFGFWGAVDFRHAGRLAEPLRLIQELVVTSLAAVAWYVAQRPELAIAFAVLSVAYHVLVYATGGRLLDSSEARS